MSAEDQIPTRAPQTAWKDLRLQYRPIKREDNSNRKRLHSHLLQIASSICPGPEVCSYSPVSNKSRSKNDHTKRCVPKNKFQVNLLTYVAAETVRHLQEQRDQYQGSEYVELHVV